MASPKAGSRVRIKTRPVTPDDVKSGLYYPHFAGLTGTVHHVYENGEVAVEVEPESLTSEMRARHRQVRDQMKTKWLDGLSEEGRSRLTEREKDFRLRYVVLVSATDLETAPPIESVPAASAHEERDAEENHRPTSEDLSRAEEEELLRRKARTT